MRESTVVMKSKYRVFNERNPVGSSVVVIKDDGEAVETIVIAPARIMGNHTVVVWLRGISDCYRLDRIIA